MKINYLLLSESANVDNLSVEQAEEKLSQFIDICSDLVNWEDEDVFYSEELYEQSVNNLEFASWLYSFEGETIEKQLFRSYLEKDLLLDEEKYKELYEGRNKEEIGGLVLFKTPSPIASFITLIEYKDEFLDLRKSFLRKSRNTEEFISGIDKTFPNLYLSNNVFKSIKHFNPINRHLNELMKHLTIINDFSTECYPIYKQGGHVPALKHLKTKGVDCSPEGDAERVRNFLAFPFVDIEEESHSIECSPHTKLYQPNSDYRIYFEWNDGKIKGRPLILVGHIGDHPYD